MYRLDVAAITAVNGPVVGAGCDLALMCALRIPSENAFFDEDVGQARADPGRRCALLLPPRRRCRPASIDGPGRRPGRRGDDGLA